MFQEYVEAPEPTSVTAIPEHTVWSTPALTAGSALTVTVTAVLAGLGQAPF